MVKQAPQFATPENTDEMVLVSDLVPHPKNEAIYSGDQAYFGSADWPQFKASIQRGILQPLVVCYDKKLKANEKGERKLRVLAGHRRLAAAKALKLEQVPCIVYPELTPKKQLEILVHSNKARRKTKTEIQAEIEALLPGARAKAAERRGQSGKGKGSAAKEIAEKTGQSERQAERGIAIADAKDEIDSDPKLSTEEKQAKKEKINKATAKSTNAGLKEARRQVAGKPKTPKAPTSKVGGGKSFSHEIGQIQGCTATVKGEIHSFMEKLLDPKTTVTEGQIKAIGRVLELGREGILEFQAKWLAAAGKTEPKKTKRKAKRKAS